MTCVTEPATTIFNRGKNYLQRVDQFARSEHNTLVAWVTGTKRYATFEYSCSCPHTWGPRKHAVAVIVAAMEYVRTMCQLATNPNLFSTAVKTLQIVDERIGNKFSKVV